MLPENPTFVIRGDDGEEYGPVNLEELREWVRENRAGLGTEVRRAEPGATWNSWQTYPELIALLAEAHASLPSTLHPTGLVISSIWRRAAAFVIDFIFLEILLNPLHLLLDRFIPLHQILESFITPATLQSLPTPVLIQLIALIVIENACVVLYFTVCHAAYGKTPAQALLRMRVVNAEGEKPSVTRAFIRSLTLVFSLNFYVPLVYVFIHPQRRAFHDVVADTSVVNT